MHRRNSNGYSLIELIIAIIIMGIVSGLLASIIAINFNTMEDVSNRKKMVTRGALAVDLFSRELGMLKDSTNLVIADDQQIQFNDKFGNTWDYSITAKTFTRQQVGVGTAVTLATPIINADTKFHYYAGNNNELVTIPLSSADRKLVRLVKLVLVMDDNSSGISLMGTVYPENLKIYNP